MQKAFTYARISQDRQGAGLGVGRQRTDCETLAKARGFEIVGAFEDNDVSAMGKTRRPGYEAMLARLQAGEAEAVSAGTQIASIALLSSWRGTSTSLSVTGSLPSLFSRATST